MGVTLESVKSALVGWKFTVDDLGDDGFARVVTLRLHGGSPWAQIGPFVSGLDAETNPLAYECNDKGPWKPGGFAPIRTIEDLKNWLAPVAELFGKIPEWGTESGDEVGDRVGDGVGDLA